MVLNSKKSRYLLIGIAIAFSAILITHNIRGILHNCFHATDFGIYQQAIYELANFEGFNPFLTIRNIQIFNDHFDPIIYAAVPFVWIFNYHPISLIFFELIVFFICLLLIWKLNPNKKYNLEILIMLLTTKAFLSGLLFPVHPSTWSILPIILMGYYYSQKNNRGFILAALSLCIFKEVFPIALIFMSLGLFRNKNYLLFLGTFTTGLFFTFLIYFARPVLMGPTISYSSLIIDQLYKNPLETILMIDFLPLFKMIYPFFIPFYYIIKKDKKELLKNPIFLFWLPIIALHVITNKTHSQYGPFLIAPLWVILIFHKEFSTFLKNKRALIITILLFILSSMGSYTKATKLGFFNKSKKCLLTSKKSEATKELKRFTKNFKENETILATGGVIPTILKPSMKIYQAGLFSERLSSYDYLLLEKNNSGDIFPFKPIDIKLTIENCPYNIILNNQFYFLAKGPIPYPCLLPLWKAWP